MVHTLLTHTPAVLRAVPPGLEEVYARMGYSIGIEHQPHILAYPTLWHLREPNDPIRPHTPDTTLREESKRPMGHS